MHVEWRSTIEVSNLKVIDKTTDSKIRTALFTRRESNSNNETPSAIR